MTVKKPPPPQYEVFERIGESQTRLELESGSWGERGDVAATAREWLRLQEQSRADGEEETLLIARRAERRAMWANIIAASAAILAAVATIIAAKIN